MVEAPRPLSTNDDDLLRTVEQCLRRPARIRLGPALEARFEADTVGARCRQAIRALAVGAVVYDAFLIGDSVLLPGGFDRAILLRLGIVTPLCLAVMLWLRREPGRRPREAVIGMLVGSAIVGGADLGISTASTALSYQFEALLGVLFLNLLVGMRLRAALVTTSVCVGGCILGLALSQPLPVTVAMAAIAGQVFTACMALICNARLQSSERHAYLLTLREMLRSDSLGWSDRALLELPHTDPLTGASNRQTFEAELAAMWQGDPDGRIGAMLIDIDHFKSFNDRYGQPAGDRCLSAVAAALQMQLRADIDLLARYGGDEFAVLLPGADLADIARVAERMRRAVAELVIPHEGGVGPARRVTISVGLASMHRGAGPADMLLRSADQALHAARQAGRDRIAPPLVSPQERRPPVPVGSGRTAG